MSISLMLASVGLLSDASTTFTPPPTPDPQVEWTCSVADNKTGAKFAIAGKILQENIPRFNGDWEAYNDPNRGKGRDIKITSGSSDFIGSHKYDWNPKNQYSHRVTLITKDSKFSPLITGAVVYNFIFELQLDGTGAVIATRFFEKKLKPSDEYPSYFDEVFAVGNCKSVSSWPSKQ